ncbi:MAG TPA: glycosyltransferase family 39 protein [Planctomycetota bacterium]|jgi:4-amino-4-deoxy-L-arabinose transferase-like glycosyltransferase
MPAEEAACSPGRAACLAESRRRERFWLWLGALIAIYFLITPWGIQNQSISNPDEPRYAAAVREMFRGSDKIVPVFNTQPRLVKPIMIYWVLFAGSAIGASLGMPLQTALHLGSLFMGLLAALGTFLMGWRFRNTRFGFLAAVLVITTHRFHDAARDILADMTLTAFLVWGWFCFLIAVDRMQRRTGAFLPLLGCYLCLGAACMTKGPVLVGAFAAAPMLAFLVWSQRTEVLKRAGLWWGVPMALAIGLWWFAVLVQRGYGNDVYHFFTTQNFERAVSAEGADGHPWPYLFYITSLGDALLPWSIALPLAWWHTWRRWRALPSDDLCWEAKFLICALVLPFAVIGLSVSKRAIYLVPLYPFLALYMVWAAENAFFCAVEPEEQRRRSRIAFVLLAAAVAWVLTAEIAVRPARERFYARAEFYHRLDQLSAGRPVMIAGLGIYEAVWYLDRPVQAVEECTLPQLAGGFSPAPDRVLVLPASFLTRNPAVAAKFVVLEGTLRRGNDEFAVVAAK